MACTSATSAPQVPAGSNGTPDPVLVAGRKVWVDKCARCHGPKGAGGAGPKLAGVVAGKYPDPADQADVVREGRRGMPSFGGSLSPAEIDAVVRYTREVL